MRDSSKSTAIYNSFKMLNLLNSKPKTVGVFMKVIRQPIVAVLGHVDHGKTTILDKIRGSAIAAKEAGGITQHIGATEIPLETIKEICGGLLKQLKAEIKIPGLLFIDTPGHEAFTTLRKRGGALADLAILVVDIIEGFKPQTYEAIEILKTYKTPFLVAANKIDKIHGWIPFENYPFSHSIQKQSDKVKYELESKIYEIVAKLNELGFNADRFDRVRDFTREVAIVPVSGKTGEGIPELLMLLVGLSQAFLRRELEITPEMPAKGTVLEVKEEHGLGVTVDVIIYDGHIKRGDTIVVGSIESKPIVTRVKALLKPRPLEEIRFSTRKFINVKEVYAASGVKIAAPNLENALAGSPLIVANKNVEKAVEEVKKEIEEIRIKTDKLGLVLKADTLGSLEALVNMLKRLNVPIRYADVGDISRKDVFEAENVTDKKLACIIGFNVKVRKDAEELAKKKGIKILTGNIIYKIVEDYENYLKEVEEEEKRKIFEKLPRPAVIKILPGYVFRHSKPAIVGIEVLAGTLRKRVRLAKDGKIIGLVKDMQENRVSVDEARKGKQLAIAIDNAVVGRNVDEGDILYTFITREELEMLEKYKKFMSEDEIEALEIIKTKIR